MPMGQTQLVGPDPAVLLNSVHEGGIYHATAPNGQEYSFTVRPGQSISNIRCATPEFENGNWVLRKVGEITTGTTATA